MNIEMYRKYYDLVIFDRDGVINETPKGDDKYILSKKNLKTNQMILKFVAALQENGVATCVATNQQCVGKKMLSKSELNAIHGEINYQILKIGGKPLEFFTCTHLISDNCECRKPKPGLLIRAMDRFSTTPSKSLFIGDQISDQLAASRAALDFLFVSTINYNP
jgi:D-glycero-D-manno-heptose 1,7-bisphosphate phosphatase